MPTYDSADLAVMKAASYSLSCCDIAEFLGGAIVAVQKRPASAGIVRRMSVFKRSLQFPSSRYEPVSPKKMWFSDAIYRDYSGRIDLRPKGMDFVRANAGLPWAIKLHRRC